jgi:hypothetical protein
MSTIRKDVAETTETNNVEGDFDASSAFLAQLNGTQDDDDADEGAPSGKSGEDEDQHENAPEGDDNDDEGSDASPESDEDDGEPGDDENDEGAEKKFADDDVYVKVTEGDAVHEVPLKNLTRLYGQEAALTRKSQEVAELRKTAEAAQEKNLTALQVLIERAKEKADPFKKIDWMAVVADPNISVEEKSALRAEAQKAYEEESFLTQSLDGMMEEISKENATKRIEEAKACVVALTTPGTKDKPNSLHIEGWNDKVYADVRSFGVKMGAPTEYVNSLTDPVSLKVLHMAMQFAKGSQRVVTTKKVNKTPKKIVKTSSSPVHTRRDNAPLAARKQAVKELRANPNKTGAAANAFYASFNIDDND